MTSSSTSSPSTQRLRLETLLDLLDLDEVAADGQVCFEGAAQPAPEDRAFGGLLLAQALIAAARTLDAPLAPLSMQADFIKGVPTDAPIRYTVHRVFDAAAMAGRTVVVSVGAEALFSATVRFGADRQQLPSYTTVQPRPVPGPEKLRDLSERFGDVAGIPPWWAMERPVEFRHVEDPPYLWRSPETSEFQSVWFKARGPMPADRNLQAAMLAYVSDMSILEPTFRVLGGTRHGGGRILSVNHSVWFHRPTDAAEWHQFDQRAPVMSHGRALGHADVFDRSGELVASVSQFGLVKVAT